jgi:tRNA (cmo5U34)-methyltransferase
MAIAKSLPKYAGPEISLSRRKMTQAEIQARFNAEVAAAYSQRRPVWLPEYESALTLVARTLRPYVASKREARILDLGAGTGNLSRRILQGFPDCHVSLVDFSENMLNEVPDVLADFPGRYTIRQADFWKMKIPAGSFDAVISSFALHHGRGDAVYQKLYKTIYHWLVDGGVFVCCDVVDGDTPELTRLNLAGWRHYLDGKLSKTDVERMFSNYRREDSPISLRKHLSFLEKAGFSNADILWKRFNFAVYMASKKSSQD